MNKTLFDQKIREWIDTVSSAGCTVNRIDTIADIRKKNGELLFSLLDTEVISPEGYKLPHIAFIRGHACLIVILLKNSTTGEEKFLMVRQRRIGNGQMSLEFPAGMLDYHTSDPVGVAVKEVFEETGLKVVPEEIFSLSDRILYSSAGASDEGLYFFGCIKSLDNQTYNSFINRTGGNPDENEHIQVELLSREQAEPQISSAQARLGFFLFEKARAKII